MDDDAADAPRSRSGSDQALVAGDDSIVDSLSRISCSGRFLLAFILACLAGVPCRGDALDRIRSSGELRYGCDQEGGGPYAYPDPIDPSRVTGFEVELMSLLAGEFGPTPVLVQGQWDTLLPVLETGRVDVVVNGYELTSPRLDQYLATRPYYLFQMELMVPRGGLVRGWESLRVARPDGVRWRVGVLGGSSAETYARDHGGGSVEVLSFNGATDAMMAAKNGQIDATLQDLPAARFYAPNYPALEVVGPPLGGGSYVMYLRRQDAPLRDRLDRGLARLIRSGELRRLYEKYGIWTALQEDLAKAETPGQSARKATGDSESAAHETSRGLALIWRYGSTLLKASAMTVFLAAASMPLAIAIGLAVALGRLYGPPPARWILATYVELIRGTPLMLQLYVLFFLLPELDVSLPPIMAGIAGLAINYSAYEAEIYRAGLQAIPGGQMEAALALGMTRAQGLRRIVIPQAVRMVIPPVTNDFIALFKDTSVCSVITLVELTKQYSILANSTGGVLEFAAASALLYLGMSLPLSWLSRWSERRLSGEQSERRSPA
ncbi:ABC transporter substrate-binding protein/permease [Isosphaeraceae bacterium EP7]